MSGGDGVVARRDANLPNRPRLVLARHRERQALDLRMEGLTFEEIGRRLEITREAARKCVTRSLEVTKADISDKADELRAIEAERLEKITEVLWPRVLEGDLRAIDRFLRTRESFRRLTGLDMTPDAGPQGPQIVVVDTRHPWARDDAIDGEAIEVPQIEAGE